MIEHPHHDDEFVLFASNLGRFVPGLQGHHIMEWPLFEHPASGSAPLPLFNGMTAYLYFAVFSKATSIAATARPGGFGLPASITGDGVWCASGPRVTLRDQFDRNVLNDDGTPSQRLVINEEYAATLLVAASLRASITAARDQAQYYLHSVNYYKHLDGQRGKQNWRDHLNECLLE